MAKSKTENTFIPYDTKNKKDDNKDGVSNKKEEKLIEEKNKYYKTEIKIMTTDNK